MNILQKFYTRKVLNKRFILIILILMAALAVVTLLSLCLGSVNISLSEIFNAFFNPRTETASYKIIHFVRIPRTAAAILAGAALAVSGAILQAVLNNKLAAPNIIGVNSGSGFFVLLASSFFTGGFIISWAAFLGALSAALLIYLISLKTSASKITIVLAGVAVSSFLNAGIDAVVTFFPNSINNITDFKIGGFEGISSSSLYFPAVFILIGLTAAVLFSFDLNTLSLGDDIAVSLGMKVKIYRFVLIIIAALLAGSAVSFSGLLGFVGLIVPHAARLLISSDNRIVIPVSALLGGIFVVVCDLMARVLFSPFEIPVGIIMSFLGGPFFIYLLIRKKG
ncbi:MAG: transport system permease protein [Clostridia bacterium]|nr:transport system permease protein [Clostridia bacterium]